MKIFVAGATGVVGRALIPRLNEAGHHVTAMSRDHARGAAITGAHDVVTADAFDADRLLRILDRVRPDVVINQLTSLAARLNDTSRNASFERTARLRRIGAANLVSAANDAGVARLVTQSLAAYAPVGSWIVDEAAPLYTTAPDSWGTTTTALLELERQALQVFRGDAVVLRFGQLYGPGTWWEATGDLTAQVRAGMLPLIGDGAGTTSFLHVEDAAEAASVAAASDATGVFNIVDHHPSPAAEWLPTLAADLRAPVPIQIGVEEALARYGWDAVFRQTRQRGATDARAHTSLGLTHLYPTWLGELGH